MKRFNIILIALLTVGSLTIYNCTVTSHSAVYSDLLNKNLGVEELGKAKFLHGDMGGIYPHTLKSNAFIYKIAVLALTAYDSSRRPGSVFSKYGFVYSDQIWNWSSAPRSTEKPTGLIFGKLNGRHPLKGKYWIETADFGCATCHGGPLYGANGLPTSQYVLGIPNTSINLQGFADDLFEGYKIITLWSDSRFGKQMLKLFPNLSREEVNGLNIIFNGIRHEVKKIVSTRGHVAPYKIGGPGTMNGIASVKMGLGMLDKSIFHEDEISHISIPTLADRSFRSSFLVSGNYAPEGKGFFFELSVSDTSTQHDEEMAPIAALFTAGTMGYNGRMAAKAIPDVREVMKFLSTFETPPFPLPTDREKVELGRLVFVKNCQSCHGTYDGDSKRNKLTSFPNRLVPIAYIKTDSTRALSITKDNLKKLNKIKLGNYFNGQINKGYVAPILSGLWTTAPFLHNGSVPTLWHLMHPDSRPTNFYVGGHQLDYEKIGVKGLLLNGVYQYPGDYQSWAGFEIYDTTRPGQSNKGHAEPFMHLTEKEKEYLIEFIKTL